MKIGFVPKQCIISRWHDNMEYDTLHTPGRRRVIKWINLSYKEKMEWEEKGKKEGKAGYDLFLADCKKQEKIEDKTKSKELYVKTQKCDECNNETLVHLGNTILVCDVCGEVTTF